MTRLMYQTDSYMREFPAMVSEVRDNAVCLDQTAFYPSGGGQPADRGVLYCDDCYAQVVDVRKEGDQVWHVLDAMPDGFQPGKGVVGRLDWERRYKLMRTHTAMHILCGVVFRDYGAQVTGGNMDVDGARMDFEFERMQQELVREIETRINAEVQAARPIHVKILPRTEAFQIPDLIRTKINLLPPGIEQVRTLEIVGLDLQADGGTHVHNTREVGSIKIVDYKSKGKINKRLAVKLED